MGNLNVLFLVAGGSGGHILPALQLGKKWLNQNPEGKIIFFCSNKKLDKEITRKNSFLDKIVGLKLQNFPGKKFWFYPQFLVQLMVAVFKSFYYLFTYKPSKILSTGGYIAVPLCVVARLFKTEIELYELNVVPGRAVKALLPFAQKIFITFENTKFFLRNRMRNFSHKCTQKNYPVRFAEQDKIFDKKMLIKEVNKTYGCDFSEDKKTIFLLGGSQGSVFLNDVFKSWLLKNKSLLSKIQVIHQTGEADQVDWQKFYKQLGLPAVVFAYHEDIKDFYLLADLVISRAGAGTLFELEFFQKRSLIIPLKSAYTDHQVDNAFEMVQRNPDLFSSHDQDDIKRDFSVFDNKMIQLFCGD